MGEPSRLPSSRRSIRPTAAAAESILTFWFKETKPYLWFRRNDAFDAQINDRFADHVAAAKAGHLDVWRAHPRYSLALIILLDQFSRNLFRDTPRAFAQDEQALDIARDAITRHHGKIADDKAKSFYYMPFMHAEDLSVQIESVNLFKAQLPGTMNLPFAIEHYEIVRDFGRFPHRNKILGRESTPAEIAFLKAGGFNP
ncbi:DUF924 family protein [Hyphococcus lacteus]|uniref:DUF924 family protein n=1 Tax=Hyphococcus lacteus TaxID=3143536 RepID=A0ABV3Z1X2_9PROT